MNDLDLRIYKISYYLNRNSILIQQWVTVDECQIWFGGMVGAGLIMVWFRGLIKIGAHGWCHKIVQGPSFPIMALVPSTKHLWSGLMGFKMRNERLK